MKSPRGMSRSFAESAERCRRHERGYCTLGFVLVPSGPATGLVAPMAGCAVLGMVALRYFTSESICASFSGPPSAFANAGIIEPALPEAIHFFQWSAFVGWFNFLRSGTKAARLAESWQFAQTPE